MKKPLIGVSLCNWQLMDWDKRHYHLVGDKYIRTITGYGCFPLMVPSMQEDLDIDFALDNMSGFMLTGSLSNIDPKHYGMTVEGPDFTDLERDATVFKLIPGIIERGIPLLGVCRGIQELNVLYGGTLHRKVHEVPGMMDHRETPDVPDEVCYAPSHRVRFTEGGLLHKTFEGKTEIMVNSLHNQGVNVLSDNLVVEAVADDGLVEAVRVKNAKGFTLATQWHPEYHFWEYPDSQRVLKLFFDACREYHAQKENMVENQRRENVA
ncbi:MAG: gamma-glutamyl-gamma-aminobutyrate hydrolase family protein [Pseudomonadota bacterium]